MAQHVLQNAPVLEVVQLVQGIDAADQRHALEGAVAGDDFGDQALARFEFAMQASNGDLLVALHAERLPGRALLEYQGHHAHADQVGAVDALERLRDDRAHPEQHRALGGPVARRAGAVFLAGEDDERNVVGFVLHRRVVHRHLLLRRVVDGDAAFDARHHLVLDADVGEGAAHHDLMVAAARAVLVEILRTHLVVAQVFAGRACFLNRSRRRDVVGGDRVEEQPEHAGVDDVLDRPLALVHVLEVRRVLHVGRAVVPLIGHSALDRDLAPVGVALEHVGVFLGEDLLGDVLGDELADLLVRGPDVLEVDLLALLIDAERILGQVDIHRAGDGVGDDERRRGEIIGAHVGVDAAFEIAVAREHRGRHQIVLVDRLGNLLRQRAGIADAGGAAEADQIEAELVEVLLQAGLLEIFGHHLRAGRQRGLHPRLGGEALGRRFAGEQAGADHHARVRGIGAGGDRRDHHVAIAEIVIPAGDGTRFFSSPPCRIPSPSRR